MMTRPSWCLFAARPEQSALATTLPVAHSEETQMTTSAHGPGSRRTRRELLQTAAAATAATAAGGWIGESPAQAALAERRDGSSGRIKQSVCRWCYGKISLDDLCVAAKRLGLVGI